MNAFFSTVSDSTVSLPVHACYRVSAGATALTLASLHDITVEGDGATFEQTAYQCGTNGVQPVLTLLSDTDITFDDITIDGPGSCSGEYDEGNYGILLGQGTPGNTNITFDHTTVENTGGDGLGVYPELGTCCGINRGIVFEDGAMINIGYHAITPEGVEGLLVSGNTFSYDSDFMDLEVDANAGPDNTAAPTGVAQNDITVSHNTFNHGSWMDFTSLEGICVPQNHLDILDNTIASDGGGFEMQLGGSGSNTCASRDDSLEIAGNVTNVPTNSPCGGSYATPPSCSMIEIADWKNVLISGNVFDAADGVPQYDYYDNTLSTPCITLQGVAMATIEDNDCANAYNLWSQYYAQWPATDFANANITDCGNVWGLTNPVAADGVTPPADPQHDAPC